ncbi:MAG: glycosyltransferase family 2 protein [Ilumatobacter sp.]|nr:glycosyltransferase family 2 protein [Ilumatobacter sp.]
MAIADFRQRGTHAGFASPTPVERRRPRPAAAGEPWTYVLNGATVRVTVSVIVPARNEAANLAALFDSLPPVYEVIVVDGHSVDGTAEQALALMPEARIITQTGRGKGNAMREGLDAATGDIAVFIDADGSNEPGEVERFVLALVNGADLAKGSRFLERGGSADITGIRRMGNAALRGIVNRMYGTRFTDLAYGFNAVWTRHRDLLELDCNGFEIETLIHIRAARLGLVIEEVPSYENQRTVGSTNLHALRDGIRIAAVLIREIADQHVNRRPEREGRSDT